jgi:hypothetical protein
VLAPFPNSFHVNSFVTIQPLPFGHCEQARKTHGKAMYMVAGIKAGRTKNRKSL